MGASGHTAGCVQSDSQTHPPFNHPQPLETPRRLIIWKLSAQLEDLMFMREDIIINIYEGLR